VAAINTSRTLGLPFAHLNLRRNPFGEFSFEERTVLADVDVLEFDDFLTVPGAAVQFVGEKGNGKTTHLLAIRARFAEPGYVHIPEGEKAAVPPGNPILIDEAQRLTWWQQRQLFRSRVPLVLGTHRDFSPELSRAGRQVRTVAVFERMSAQRLTRILNARIAWVRRDQGPVPSVSCESAGHLLEQCGPDIRQILFEMYEKFQNLPEGCRDVEV
jgi:hypothetical protein